MKKIFRNMMALAIAVFAFAACEDVPAPYGLPSENGNGGETVQTIGSLDEPITVARALQIIDGMANDATSKEYVYVKGIVVSINTDAENFSKYGNINYTISDDGKNVNTITVFRGDGMNGELFKTINDIKPGDEVVVYGTLTRFMKNGAVNPEISQGNYLVKLVPGVEKTTVYIGSPEEPKTVAEALAVVNGLQEGETTEEWYYIKGKVKNIVTKEDDIAKYTNIDYYITDDGNNEIQVFRGKNIDNTDFTGPGQLNVGDEVVVVGQLMKYKKNETTIVPEVVKGNYIVKLTKGETPQQPDQPDQPDQPGEYGSADVPLTVAKALEIISGYEMKASSPEEAYVKGVVVSVENYNSKYKSLTYNISDNGSDTAVLKIYSGKGVNGGDFSSENDLKPGAVVVVKGTLKKYAEGDSYTPEIDKNSVIISIENND